MASEIVLVIGVVIAAEWVFVRAIGALQVATPARAPTAVAAKLWALNHALMVTAMVLGAIVAMVGAFSSGLYATVRPLLRLIVS